MPSLDPYLTTLTRTASIQCTVCRPRLCEHVLYTKPLLRATQYPTDTQPWSARTSFTLQTDTAVIHTHSASRHCENREKSEYQHNFTHRMYIKMTNLTKSCVKLLKSKENKWTVRSNRECRIQRTTRIFWASHPSRCYLYLSWHQNANKKKHDVHIAQK